MLMEQRRLEQAREWQVDQKKTAEHQYLIEPGTELQEDLKGETVVSTVNGNQRKIEDTKLAESGLVEPYQNTDTKQVMENFQNVPGQNVEEAIISGVEANVKYKLPKSGQIKPQFNSLPRQPDNLHGGGVLNQNSENVDSFDSNSRKNTQTFQGQSRNPGFPLTATFAGPSEVFQNQRNFNRATIKHELNGNNEKQTNGMGYSIDNPKESVSKIDFQNKFQQQTNQNPERIINGETVYYGNFHQAETDVSRPYNGNFREHQSLNGNFQRRNKASEPNIPFNIRNYQQENTGLILEHRSGHHTSGTSKPQATNIQPQINIESDSNVQSTVISQPYIYNPAKSVPTTFQQGPAIFRQNVPVTSPDENIYQAGFSNIGKIRQLNNIATRQMYEEGKSKYEIENDLTLTGESFEVKQWKDPNVSIEGKEEEESEKANKPNTELTHLYPNAGYTDYNVQGQYGNIPNEDITGPKSSPSVDLTVDFTDSEQLNQTRTTNVQPYKKYTGPGSNYEQNEKETGNIQGGEYKSRKNQRFKLMSRGQGGTYIPEVLFGVPTPQHTMAYKNNKQFEGNFKPQESIQGNIGQITPPGYGDQSSPEIIPKGYMYGLPAAPRARQVSRESKSSDVIEGKSGYGQTRRIRLSPDDNINVEIRVI